MAADGAAIDLPEPPPPPDIAALMASPEFQARMAALTQQATAQLAALVESLRAAEAQLALPPPPLLPVEQLPAPPSVMPEIEVSPEMQAQIAALTQQAAAQAAALAAALKAAESESGAPQPKPETGGIDPMPFDGLYGPAVLWHEAPVFTDQPGGAIAAKFGGKDGPAIAAPASATVAPHALPDAIAMLDDLVPLPAAAPAPAPAAVELPAAASQAEDPHVMLAAWTTERGGPEGSAL